MAENFNWLEDYTPNCYIGQKLLELYHEAQPRPMWNPEIDAAIRIILCAAEGSLASREDNEAILCIIRSKLHRNKLYNADLILLASDILDNPYLFCDNTERKLVSPKHQKIIKSAKDQIPLEMRINLLCI
jgi:hypothetical protein